ncbi:MAG: type II secretion system protein [Sedimentisphaerales bacterium]|jgi:type II secretory pathway pseudopilin PulG
MTSTKTKGFTIIELLTVMSIIIILMSVLVPGLARTRRYAKVVVQQGQFHEISKGLELYRNDHQETYPDSGATDTNTTPVGYCGAMKLCEALLGQDGMGNSPLSNFQASQPSTYLFDLCYVTDPTKYTGPTANATLAASLRNRTKYAESDSVKAYRLQDIYNWVITTGVNFYAPTAKFTADDGSASTPSTYPNAVIGDVFQKATINATHCPARTGQKVGMPVLYYKADSSKIAHDVITVPVATTPNTNIYNFDDNYAITALGCPWESAKTTDHPMFTDPRVFLTAITNDKITSTPRPHNEDGYILLSAGWDGLYGTQDDVYNFAK